MGLNFGYTTLICISNYNFHYKQFGNFAELQRQLYSSAYISAELTISNPQTIVSN
jgi:hypothetical protein